MNRNIFMFRHRILRWFENSSATTQNWRNNEKIREFFYRLCDYIFKKNVLSVTDASPTERVPHSGPLQSYSNDSQEHRHIVDQTNPIISSLIDYLSWSCSPFRHLAIDVQLIQTEEFAISEHQQEFNFH